MPNTNETAKVFNTPNYAGELYTASPVETPFLTLIGGTGGSRALRTENQEFPTCSLYEHDTPVQPSISENESLTAPTPYTFVRTQETNVTQIFHETISVSYAKEANRGRLSGVNTVDQKNNAPSELDFQTTRTLEKIARKMEHTFLNGVYNKATTSAEAFRTRGIIEAAGTKLDVAAAPLTKAMIDGILKQAWANGALFKDFFFIVNGSIKQQLTQIYNEVNGFRLPPERNVSGLNITRIETDFGFVNIALNKFMPAATLLGADLSVIAPVEQDTPGKGNFFREALSKKGAADEFQIYGMAGLDHGPSFMHLAIANVEV